MIRYSYVEDSDNIVVVSKMPSDAIIPYICRTYRVVSVCDQVELVPLGAAWEPDKEMEEELDNHGKFSYDV